MLAAPMAPKLHDFGERRVAPVTLMGGFVLPIDVRQRQIGREELLVAAGQPGVRAVLADTVHIHVGQRLEVDLLAPVARHSEVSTDASVCGLGFITAGIFRCIFCHVVLLFNAEIHISVRVVLDARQYRKVLSTQAVFVGFDDCDTTTNRAAVRVVRAASVIIIATTTIFRFQMWIHIVFGQNCTLGIHYLRFDIDICWFDVGN